MRLSKEIIDRKLAEAPEAVRNAVMSEETANKLVEIGKRHNLHIDQLGILAEESLYAMIGLSTSEEFSKNIKGGLRISPTEISQIAQEINTEVMGVIRENLQKPTVIEQKTTHEKTESTEKAAILAEIENPTPTEHPISTAHEFIAGKMNEPVSLPAQKYSADPYRESI